MFEDYVNMFKFCLYLAGGEDDLDLHCSEVTFCAYSNALARIELKLLFPISSVPDATLLLGQWEIRKPLFDHDSLYQR